METCCRGGAGGAGCAKAGATRPRKAMSRGGRPSAGPDDRLRVPTATIPECRWARFALPTLRRTKNLVIDYNAPWNAADRNRNRGLAGPQIDDGDVVTEAVGDIKGLFVARHAEAPGAFTDQDVALNLSGRYVNHGDVGGVTECHIGGLAVPGDAQIDRRHIGLAHARRQELDLAFDGKFLTVDDIDFAGQFSGHP